MPRFWLPAVLILASSVLSVAEEPARRPVHTYSIVARDPRTGEIGVAVQSHWFGVGALVPWAEAGVGAVATQSFVDPSYGKLGLDLMRAGRSGPDALKGLLAADENREVRQVAILDAGGKVATHTGSKCIPMAGHHVGENYSVQANLMLNDTVPGAMARAFEASEGDLAERMLQALEAAQKAGGDIRGKQAAGLVVVAGTSTGKPWVDRRYDLRVDDHPEPIVELRRLVRLQKAYNLMNDGDLAVEKHDPEAALKAYAGAETLVPDNAEMIFWHAVALVNMKRVDEAVPLFRKTFAIDPNWRTLTPRLVGVGLLPDDKAALEQILRPASDDVSWTPGASGTTARLRGISVVDGQTAWASGAGGAVLATRDGGKSWQIQTVPEAGDLDFRDVHAVDASVAHLLSIGEGEKSRIYRTSDGGASWTMSHKNRDPRGFLDALSFWDADHGLALGDPVDGRYTILTTDDGGRSWQPVSSGGMPEALPGEGAFAASGTCLTTFGTDHAWFGTGGGKSARVFRSTNRGRTWTAHPTPILSGSPSAGIFSLGFADADHGVAVGGDYKQPDRPGTVVALTADGGRTWTEPEGQKPRGYRSAVALLPGSMGKTLVAVGPTGGDRSLDLGATWQPFGNMGFHALGFGRDGSGWAVGETGRVARFTPGH